METLDIRMNDRIIEGLKEIRNLQHKLGANRDLIKKLATLSRRTHTRCSDEFFDCEFIKEEHDGICDCGAEEHNIKVNLLYKEIK